MLVVVTQASETAQDRFRFVGGRPCLNLVATYGKRHAEGLERLPDDDALLDWLVAAGVLPARTAVTVRPGQLDTLRGLRESLNRLIRAAMATKPFDPPDVALVNQVAASPDLAPQLGAEPGPAGGGGITWGAHDPIDAAMATLARDGIDLLAGSRASRVKECEHPDCSLLFLDDSQSGRRRWCSMDRCGNLMKVAGYRRRKRP